MPTRFASKAKRTVSKRPKGKSKERKRKRLRREQ